MEYVVDEVQEEEATANGDYYALALFREADGDVTGMEFQRGVGGIYGRPEDGTPPYCLVTAQHRTFFGGVARVEWLDSTVVVDVTDEARTVLWLPDNHVVFRLDLPDDRRLAVKRGLRRIFGVDHAGMREPDLIGF